MNVQLEAVYENGVFRPLQPVQLAEHQRVTVTIEAETTGSTDMLDLAHFTLPPERWQAFCNALDAPPREIPALRELLTSPSLVDKYKR